MRAVGRLAVLVPCVLGAQLSSAAVARLPFVDLSGDLSRQTVVAAGTKDLYQGHPTTLLADDGKTIFCMWSTGHGGPCSHLARSDDGGRTWKRLDDLLPAAYVASNCNCPTLQKIIGPDGRTRYFAFSCKVKKGVDQNGRSAWSSKAAITAGLGILVSEDGGASWWEVPHQPQLSAHMPPTGLMRLKDGTTALFGQVRTDRTVMTDGAKDDQSVWMSVSRDGGFTWGEMRIVAAKAGRNLCEPFCLRSPDGRSLALLMRDNRHTGRSAIAFSHDEGLTWTEPRDTCAGLTGDRHEGVWLPDGRCVIAFRNQTVGDPLRGQYMAWVGTWDDLVNGREGQYRVRLLNHHGKVGRWPGSELDTGYSGVELLPDGTIVCTTYSIVADDGCQSSIVSTRFKVDELDVAASGGDAAVPAFDLKIPGSGYDRSKPDCGMSAARVFDTLESSRIGTLALRPAKDLPETSSASVGFEGLDRKLFDPTDDVYDRLAACGVKRARVQTMWSRCETQKGVHDFSALDEVIRNLTARGIKPWFSVTFGNTLYMAGCRTQAAVGNVPLYYGDECRAAWLAYVRALARRYRGQVAEWEIWNEPNCSNFWQPRGANARDYIELVKIAGEAIRSEIPDVKIGGTTSSGNLLDWERTFFECGGARYIDFWSFHPYGLLPEGISHGGAVRDFVQEHVDVRAFIDSNGGGHVRIWQGESGCPSWFHKDHWLFPKGVCQQGWQSQANQAKWLLRRFVTDRRAGFDMSSFYQACDIVRRYSMAVTTRPHPAEHGLLNGWTHEPKMSYRAMGHYNALLADAKYDPTIKARVRPTEDAGARTVVAGFRTAGGRGAYVYYAPFDFSGSYTGTVYRARTDAKLTLPKGAALKQPVVVDLLRGGIYAVKDGVVCGDEVEYDGLPLVDYPVVLTDRPAAPSEPASK